MVMFYFRIPLSPFPETRKLIKAENPFWRKDNKDQKWWTFRKAAKNPNKIIFGNVCQKTILISEWDGK